MGDRPPGPMRAAGTIVVEAIPIPWCRPAVAISRTTGLLAGVPERPRKPDAEQAVQAALDCAAWAAVQDLERELAGELQLRPEQFAGTWR